MAAFGPANHFTALRSVLVYVGFKYNGLCIKPTKMVPHQVNSPDISGNTFGCTTFKCCKLKPKDCSIGGTAATLLLLF